MVIDYDAHHGDGTQRAFYNSPADYTVSFHQDPSTLYPFRTGYEKEIGIAEGKSFNRNFPLSQFCDDEEFISNVNRLMDLQNKYGFKTLVLGGGGFVHPMLGQNWGIQIKNFIRK